MSYIRPTRFHNLKPYLKKNHVKVLDIGSGSNSPSLTKKWISNCEYHGVDLEKYYQNDEVDIRSMDSFYEMDLTKLEFESIPENYFDYIIMSHIIEHLHNGDQVITNLLPKLKRGGIIYIEFPSPKSVTLPKMRGTLNFYDDTTHCRLFSFQEVEMLLKNNGFNILRSGTRRDWLRIILIPLLVVHSISKYGFITGSVFWDLMGFAEFVIGEKQ